MPLQLGQWFVTGDVTTLLWVNSSNTLVSIYHLFTGGDLALFISGLQQAVNKVKKMAGEETKDLSSSARGVAA